MISKEESLYKGSTFIPPFEASKKKGLGFRVSFRTVGLLRVPMKAPARLPFLQGFL